MRSRLYFPTMPNALRKRGVTRKTLYSEYIKRYPQGYSYCSFNRFLCAYIASHKSLFKGFGACGLPANHSANGLEFPLMAKVISRMVWSFRAWRKSFPEWFGISAFSESYFPNSLGLVVAKIWNKNLSGFWIYNYQGASIGTVSTIFSTYFVLHKKNRFMG